MLQINLGDLGPRLVKAFGLKGRVPQALDENVVPVCTVFDATDPVFIDNPHYCIAFGALQGNVNAAVIVLQNLSPNILTMVDKVSVNDASGAAPATQMVFLIARQQADLTQTLQSTEFVTNAKGAVPLPPVTTFSSGQPAAVPGVGAVSFSTFWPALKGYAVIDLGIVLYQGDALVMYFPPGTAGTMNEQITIYFHEHQLGG
jgi:hypothetical protein